MGVYDDPGFFHQYKGMERSKQGLQAAGEWPALKKMLPAFDNKKVLDLGCGFGWHSLYAAEHGASSVLGVDNSEKMLQVAHEKKANVTFGHKIQYLQLAMEDMQEIQGDASFDIVLSSLAIHYVASFDKVAQQVARLLKPGGHFVMSVEHPIFTAEGSQNWYTDDQGNILHWPVDAYFDESVRQTNFLGCRVTKYHRTLTSYIQGLLNNHFQIYQLVEPLPEPELLIKWPNETRRPMMLLIAALKS
ncbi:S-adenosyl-L-methionine-dependent methyltransferase [Hesseltinella vesiculosa]|uniref:S-adenosyl-L-methionine-dependent methyltransferase n=1 Tax=Hesseltinella vesiculosa TaxID=101127 RepID=A0A1X2GHP0_9FUNG|nr:S-adenosyl-L-methionine-dependent methyltransferase [Hesseltinella vesiculosa]